MKFKKAYKEYLEYAELELKPSSIKTLKEKINNNVLKELENKKIKKITKKDIKKIERKMTLKGYSTNYISNTIYCIKSIYNYLEIYYKINNILKDYKIEKEKNKKLEVWTIEEYKRFINIIEDKEIKIYFKTLFETGARKNEIVALKWGDIDRTNQIKIKRTRTKIVENGKHIYTTPKNKKEREIEISSELYKEIKSIEKKNEYIFNLSDTTIQRKFKEYIKKAKVKEIRIHDIRHTNATILYESGIDIKVISERLGHTSVQTTIDIYVKTNEKQKKRAVKLLSKINN